MTRQISSRRIVAQAASRFAIDCVGIALLDGKSGLTIDHDNPAQERKQSQGATLYHAASSGKHVTACVILGLVQRGLLALDATIGDYLPGLPEGWRERRLRSLLHHTSGLPDYLMALGGDAPPATAADFLALCATLPAGVPDGQGWHYSNTNYILLGLIAAAVAGRPCGRQMQDLLECAGADEARICTPEWARAANLGTVDVAQGDDAALDRAVVGDGDVAFTTGAALAWMRWLLVKISGGGVFAELVAPATLRVGGPAPYGSGLFLESVGSERIVHHAGHFDGWTAMIYLNLDQPAGVFALCNLAPGNTRAVRAVALRALESFSPGATPLSLPPIADDTALTSGLMAQLFRADAPPDLARFAPAMRPGPGTRGIADFQAGGIPAAIELVESTRRSGGEMRRYRLSHADRTEHLSVGIDDVGRINWAWPL